MSTNRPMRMKNREVTDPAAINELIEKMDAIRVGFFDGEEVYVIPLSFGYKEEDGKYTFYMHGAKKGRKADLVAQCKTAGFELDRTIEVRTAGEPCNHTVTYNSIIGHGAIDEVTDKAEKIEGMNLIMKQNTGKGDWEFPDKMIDGTFIIRITADWLTAKVHE